MQHFYAFNESKWIGPPPPPAKKTAKTCFLAPKSPKGTLIQTSKVCAYLINNQLHMRCILEVNSRSLIFKTAGTDFEFNKPILKKWPPILKDFEGFASFFEGF